MKPSTGTGISTGVVLLLLPVPLSFMSCKKPPSQKEQPRPDAAAEVTAVPAPVSKADALDGDMAQGTIPAAEEPQAATLSWSPEFPVFPKRNKSQIAAEFTPEYAPGADATEAIVVKGLLRAAVLYVDGKAAVLGDGAWTKKIPVAPGAHSVRVACGTVAEHAADVQVEAGKEVEVKIPTFFAGKGGLKILRCGGGSINQVVKMWSEEGKAFGLIGKLGIEYFDGTHWSRIDFDKGDIALAQVGQGGYIVVRADEEYNDSGEPDPYSTFWFLQDGKWSMGQGQPYDFDYFVFPSDEKSYLLEGDDLLVSDAPKASYGRWEGKKISGKAAWKKVLAIGLVSGELYGVAWQSGAAGAEGAPTGEDEFWVFRGEDMEKVARIPLTVPDKNEYDYIKFLVAGNQEETIIASFSEGNWSFTGVRLWKVEGGEAKPFHNCKNLEMKDLWAKDGSAVSVVGCSGKYPAFCWYDGASWREGGWDTEEGCISSTYGDSDRLMMVTKGGVVVVKQKAWKQATE